MFLASTRATEMKIIKNSLKELEREFIKIQEGSEVKKLTKNLIKTLNSVIPFSILF